MSKLTWKLSQKRSTGPFLQVKLGEAELHDLQNLAKVRTGKLEDALSSVIRDHDRLLQLVKSIERFTTDGNAQSVKDALATHEARKQVPSRSLCSIGGKKRRWTSILECLCCLPEERGMHLNISVTLGAW